MLFNSKHLLESKPIVDMLDQKYKDVNNISYGLSEAGYDIRIKQEIVFAKGFTIPRLVLRDGDLTSGRFVLASSIEEFRMPRDLVGVVHDKSTWARRGLSVFNTVIESGWNGWLTLELVYHGDDELTIPAGSGIAQVLFHRTTCDTQYSGKYQNQPNEPVEAK